MSAGNATGSSRAAGVSPRHALALATISLPSWVCWALTCGRAVGTALGCLRRARLCSQKPLVTSTYEHGGCFEREVLASVCFSF